MFASATLLPPKSFTNLGDIHWLRAAEAVDRLALIGDNPDVLSLIGQRFEEHRACPIGVLILIDQHMLVTRDLRSYVGVRLDELGGKKDEVAEINGIFFPEKLFVNGMIYPRSRLLFSAASIRASSPDVSAALMFVRRSGPIDLGLTHSSLQREIARNTWTNSSAGSYRFWEMVERQPLDVVLEELQRTPTRRGS